MSMKPETTEARLTFRRYKDGDYTWRDFHQKIFEGDHSHKCPTYIQSTPPCQGSCPSGEDIRGYLNIVRGIEKPPAGMKWQEYAWRRLTQANPFPSVMGRVCPAPCETGCNRNEVEDHVGINSVERFLGDEAIKQGDIESIQLLRDFGFKLEVSHLHAAIKFGHEHAVLFLI